MNHIRVRKGLTAILSTALVLSFAGCAGGDTAEGLYKEAAQIWQEADRVAMDLSLHATISQNGGSVQNNLEATLYHLGRTDSTPTLFLEGTMNLDMGTGTPMSVPLTYVYWEGALYADLSGVRYRQNVTPDQLETQAYQGLGLFDHLKAEDFRNLTLEEGSRTITFGIGAEQVRSVAENLSQIREYREIYGDGLTVNFSDAEGTFVMNEDGSPQSMTVQIAAELSAEGFSSSATYQITEQYLGFGDAVEVTLPDLSGYEALDGGETQDSGQGESQPSGETSGEESSQALEESQGGEGSQASGETQAEAGSEAAGES